MTRFAPLLMVVFLWGCPPLQRFKCDRDASVDCNEETGGGGDGQGGGTSSGGGQAQGGGSSATGGGTSGVGGSSGLGGGSTLQEHQKQYEDTRKQLETFRTQFRDKTYLGPVTVGDFVYFQSKDSHLHRYSPVSNTNLDYTFTLRAGSFRASESMIVGPSQQAIERYEAFDANDANKSLGAVTLPFKDVNYIYPYAVSGNTLYIVKEEAGVPTLFQWQPNGSLSPFVAVKDATHTTVGTVSGFAALGDLSVFLEGGRLWKMSFSTKQATLLATPSGQVEVVDFNAENVAWRTYPNGLFAMTGTDTSPQNVANLINNNVYQFNSDYPYIHNYEDGEFTFWKNWLIYISRPHGVMAYHLKTHEIRPILLIESGAAIRIVYIDPQVTLGGQLFLTALESTSGSIGVDGPIVQVDLTTTLKQ